MLMPSHSQDQAGAQCRAGRCRGSLFVRSHSHFCERCPDPGSQPLTCREAAVPRRHRALSRVTPVRLRQPAMPRRPPRSLRPLPPQAPARPKSGRPLPPSQTPYPTWEQASRGSARPPRSPPRSPAAGTAAAARAARAGWRAPSAARPTRGHGDPAVGARPSRLSEPRNTASAHHRPCRLSTSRRSSRAAGPRLSHCHLSDSLVQTSPIERGFRASSLRLAEHLATPSQGRRVPCCQHYTYQSNCSFPCGSPALFRKRWPMRNAPPQSPLR